MMNARGAEAAPLTVHQTVIVLVQGEAFLLGSCLHLLSGVHLTTMKVLANAAVASVRHLEVFLRGAVALIPAVPLLAIPTRIDWLQFQLRNGRKLVLFYLLV